MKILDKNTINDFEDWYSNFTETGSVVLIDKDTDWTSFDVVAKLRPMLRIKKIGHAGTLDPLATGLLIIGLGKATKKLTDFQNLYKTYTGTIKLGATTKTDDAEADEENITETDNLSDDDILTAVKLFIGEIDQTPPIYSAKKIKGQRLYKLARKNIEVEIPSSTVVVHEFNVKNIDLPLVEFEVKCSKGTYIRSLARDLGEKLNVGGYLSSLRRNGIGEYNVDDALTIQDMIELKEKYLDQDK